MKKQLAILQAVWSAGLTLVAVTGVISIFLIRVEIIRLSQKTSPLQVNLAKLQRTFESVSGNFARISAANNPDELQALETDTTATLAEVERIATELSRSADSPQEASLDEMRRTHAELHKMAQARLEARRRIAESYQYVSREIESATAVTQHLSTAMAELQNSSQDGLVKAKKTSQDSNTGIKSMLVVREELGQVQSLLQDVRMVDKKFRLNVLRDKVKGVLDTMAAQEMSDPAMAGAVKIFVARFDEAYQGDAGLLAARADVIANPQDAKAVAKFEEKNKTLVAMLGSLATKLSEGIDPLELAVQTANGNMNKATKLIASVSTVSAVTAEVNARARSIQGLAWQLLASNDIAAAEHTRQQIGAEDDQVAKLLSGLRSGLAALDRKNDVAAVENAVGAFRRVRDKLIGAEGVASVVRQGLEQQSQAERLFANAQSSIKQIAQAGSARARDAEDAQAEAVQRMERGTFVTFVVLGLVAVIAYLIAWQVGRRIRVSILEAEAQHQDNIDMHHLISEVLNSTEVLRQSSKQLNESCAVTTKNLESVAGGAREMEASLGEIARSAVHAADVGKEAGVVIQEASLAFQGLAGASKEISRVTHMIQGISLKTSMLSLNAAVEAERAGVAGRGFAVVAAEVKALAGQASSSSEEIDARIVATQQEVDKAYKAFERIKGFIEQIGAMQTAIATSVRRHTEATSKIGVSIQETAVHFTGSRSQGGIRDMAKSLTGMAGNLAKLCEGRGESARDLKRAA